MYLNAMMREVDGPVGLPSWMRGPDAVNTCYAYQDGADFGPLGGGVPEPNKLFAGGALLAKALPGGMPEYDKIWSASENFADALTVLPIIHGDALAQVRPEVVGAMAEEKWLGLAHEAFPEYRDMGNNPVGFGNPQVFREGSGDVTVTSGARAGAFDGPVDYGLPFSTHIYGSDSPQFGSFNQTTLRLLALRWFQNGDVDALLDYQRKKMPAEKCIDAVTMGELCEVFQRAFADEPRVFAFLAKMMVLTPLGNTSRVDNKIYVSERNPDGKNPGTNLVEKMFNALKEPEVAGTFETFMLMEAWERRLAVMIHKAESRFNLGQARQGEASAADFAVLGDMTQQEFKILCLYNIMKTLGVLPTYAEKGADGAEVRKAVKGTAIFDKPRLMADLFLLQAADQFYESGTTTPQETYFAYMEKCAEYLGFEVSEDRDSREWKEQMAATRLALVFHELMPSRRDYYVGLVNGLGSLKSGLVEELTTSGLGGEPAMLMYYMPSQVENAQKMLKAAHPEKTPAQVDALVVRLLGKLFRQARDKIRDLGQAGGTIQIRLDGLVPTLSKNPDPTKKKEEDQAIRSGFYDRIDGSWNVDVVRDPATGGLSVMWVEAVQ